jgi:hypothetical protein
MFIVELIDLDTRHALGEYYTPDWLCECVVTELTITSRSSFLDPVIRARSARRSKTHQAGPQFQWWKMLAFSESAQAE